ncbi:hypothetical protein ACOSP7_027275 [Xanthoceras sorbifolium]
MDLVANWSDISSGEPVLMEGRKVLEVVEAVYKGSVVSSNVIELSSIHHNLDETDNKPLLLDNIFQVVVLIRRIGAKMLNFTMRRPGRRRLLKSNSSPSSLIDDVMRVVDMKVIHFETEVWVRAGQLLSDFGSSISSCSPLLFLSRVYLLFGSLILLGFKVNVDAATNISECCFGVGIVIRNSLGCVVFAAAFFYLMFFNVEVSEARAILVGILCAGKKGFSLVCVESDASIVNLCSRCYYFSGRD